MDKLKVSRQTPIRNAGQPGDMQLIRGTNVELNERLYLNVGNKWKMIVLEETPNIGSGRTIPHVEKIKYKDRDVININDTSLVVSKNLKVNASQNWLGIKKFQSFVGTLANTNGGSVTYGANDVLVELGILDTTVPVGHVKATKFFIDKVIIGITTASGVTSLAKLDLSATPGTATNTAVSSPTEICGAGVASFNPRISATDAVTEVDINLEAAAGTYHVFEPNITADIAKKYLYLATETAISANTCQQSRFTVLLEYTVF